MNKTGIEKSEHSFCVFYCFITVQIGVIISLTNKHKTLNKNKSEIVKSY